MNTERIKLDLISAISQTNNPSLLFEMSTDEEVIKLSKNHIEETGNVLFGVQGGECVSYTEHKNQVNE